MLRKWSLRAITLILPVLVLAGTPGSALARQPGGLPEFINMQYTIALCKGKPVGFWEYDYTIFTTARDLNFNYALKVKPGLTVRVPRGVYEFYKSHPKAIQSSLFYRGRTADYDLIQLRVPVVKNPRWHEYVRVDLAGTAAPKVVSGGSSANGGGQTCAAGTVRCGSNG